MNTAKILFKSIWKHTSINTNSKQLFRIKFNRCLKTDQSFRWNTRANRRAMRAPQAAFLGVTELTYMRTLSAKKLAIRAWKGGLIGRINKVDNGWKLRFWVSFSNPFYWFFFFSVCQVVVRFAFLMVMNEGKILDFVLLCGLLAVNNANNGSKRKSF